MITSNYHESSDFLQTIIVKIISPHSNSFNMRETLHLRKNKCKKNVKLNNKMKEYLRRNFINEWIKITVRMYSNTDANL